MSTDLHCPRCDFTASPTVTWRTFSNGTPHLEARCRRCTAFIKFLPQQERWICMVPSFIETTGGNQ